MKKYETLFIEERQGEIGDMLKKQVRLPAYDAKDDTDTLALAMQNLRNHSCSEPAVIRDCVGVEVERDNG